MKRARKLSWRKPKRQEQPVVQFGHVYLPDGTAKNAAEMLRMAQEHQKISKGVERGLAISLEAALIALQNERTTL